MKRIITAILTLALTATLSTNNAFAIAANTDYPETLFTGIVDSNDCPNIMDLWFELVDAGYSVDEVFEIMEIVMDQRLIAGSGRSR
ncbi:MAG: hypothetical protein MK110_12195 [Fuerstiella sp.]|nr:hypothetical protein [Fuerstiella sp.]